MTGSEGEAYNPSSYEDDPRDALAEASHDQDPVKEEHDNPATSVGEPAKGAGKPQSQAI